jgi:prepilin-type N-terminal cleavage/methylation domain-containing protein
MRKQGFTLIELMIAILIMGILSLFTAQNIRDWTKMKTKIQSEVDRWSDLFNALQIMERDINLTFNYRDIAWEVDQEIKKKRLAEEQKQSGFAAPPVSFGKEEEAPKKLTQLKGDNKSLHFTNLNNVRKAPDIKESDQQEVSYFIKKCKSRFKQDTQTDCLWRRSTPYIDDKIEEGGTAVPLLEHVKDFELQYIGAKKEDWQNSWNTTDSTDVDKSNTFPDAVKITLATDVDGKVVQITSIVALRFPNNITQNTMSQNNTLNPEEPPQPPNPGGGQ